MPAFDDRFKDELRSKIDLATYIGKFVKLERSGTRYKACCPFHHEKTASFVINTHPHSYYHCFGCGESGDIITFAMKYENMDFLTAIKHLAEVAGIEVPEMVDDGKIAQTKQKRQRLLELLKDAARHYAFNLYQGHAKKHMDYLEQRGISLPLAKKFGIGAALGRFELIDVLRRKGYTDEEIVESSIGGGSSGNIYDNFNNRLIFPIINSFNEVIAFGGRALPDAENTVKYYNSKNTLVFEKSKTIFGINLLKKKRQIEKTEIFPIIVEGYMDVVALHSAGFDSAVASMGTALTHEQARLLRSYSTKIYISYDGDSAGQSATIKGLLPLAQEGFNVRVCQLDNGLDPDDIIKKRGVQAYQSILEQALPLIEFRLKNAEQGLDIDSSEGRNKYCVEAVKIISELNEPIEQEEYLRQISKKMRYSFDALKRQLEKSRVEDAPITEPLKGEKLDECKLFVLNSWFNQKPFIDSNDDILSILDKSYEREAFLYFKDCLEKGEKPNSGKLFDIYGENSKEAGALIDYGIRGDEVRFYADCMKKIAVDRLREQLRLLEDEYNSATDLPYKMELAQKINDTTRKIRNGG